jgi:hypothetical protein
MKVSVPSSYSPKEPAKVLELGANEVPAPESTLQPGPGLNQIR